MRNTTHLYLMAGVLDTLQGLENLMRELVETHSLSHNRTSVILKQMYPIYTRGLSEMSVRRYCSAHGIHKTSLATLNWIWKYPKVLWRYNYCTRNAEWCQFS